MEVRKLTRSLIHVGIAAGLLLAGCTSGSLPPRPRPNESVPPPSASTPSTVGIGSTTPPVDTSTTAAAAAASGLPSPVACGTENQPAYAATGPISVPASDGPYSAILSGTLTGSAGNETLQNGRIRVTRAGGDLFTVSLAPPQSAGPSVVPWSLNPDPSGTDQPVCLADFGGTPAALVGIFTGGAHCCVVVAAVPLAGPGAGTAIYRGPADTGATVRALGGTAAIVTADASFDYLFASHAGSGMPIIVLEVIHDAFVDETLQHRDLLLADDQQMWDNWLQDQNTEGLGVLAAWVADECRIGSQSHAFATLDILNSQGKLHNAYGSWPSGTQYLTQLQTFLRQHGYC